MKLVNGNESLVTPVRNYMCEYNQLKDIFTLD